MAQVGKRRVLVVERHFKLGGFTHSFRRKDYEWDVGVHYVGEMQPGAMTRRIMDLVTRKGVDWHRIGSPFERFVFPEGKFEVPDDPKLYMQKLIERFPAEEANIRTYFKDLKKAQAWVARWFVGKQLPKWLASLWTFFGKKRVSQTTGEYLSRFKDPLLKAILPAQ
ncbi:MAG: FAD-dependent oxidoreductase, partial [Phycisphaerae bacterium]